VIRDILSSIRDAGKSIKPTRLLYSSNLSPQMFKEYIEELSGKGFIQEDGEEGKRQYALTKKGYEFLEQYQVILKFIGNFGL
jgi:predicted transcriptional regulator